MTTIDIHRIGLSTYPSGSSYGPYTTASHELVWIEEGDVELTSEGETHRLRPASVVFARPGEFNFYRWDVARTTRHGWIHFSIADDAARLPRLRHLAHDDVILALLAHIRWLEIERPAGWADLARDALGYTLRVFLTGASRTSAQDERDVHPAIERSMRHVRTLWSAGTITAVPTLPELARAAAVTPEHLCRVYKKELDCSPIEALRLLRLNRAATLLARSTLPVGAIANRAGFGNQFHFSRAFKRVYGASPTQFRQRPHLGPDLPPAILRLGSSHLRRT